MDERSPEDQLTIELAKAQRWRRCPGCHAIVELTQGCHHIRCLCKKEFCFKCGSLWDTKRSRCTSDPACELWDEAMLLGTREMQREAVADRMARAAARPPAMRLPPLPPAPPAFPNLLNLFGGRAAPEPPRPAPQLFNPVTGGDFDWIDDSSIASLGHPFTRGMIASLTCGYCDSRLNSINDLRYHLSNVRYHSVFSCCGRFFKREVDLQKHQEAKWDHHHSVTRNA